MRTCYRQTKGRSLFRVAVRVPKLSFITDRRLSLQREEHVSGGTRKWDHCVYTHRHPEFPVFSSPWGLEIPELSACWCKRRVAQVSCTARSAPPGGKGARRISVLRVYGVKWLRRQELLSAYYDITTFTQLENEEFLLQQFVFILQNFPTPEVSHYIVMLIDELNHLLFSPYTSLFIFQSFLENTAYSKSSV